MSRIERNWQYAEQYPTESDAQVRARRLALEFGVEPVSRATAAALSSIVASSAATNICEVGTGLGVSGLALLRYAPDAMLTSIEHEPEHLHQARSVFAEAGIASTRLRLIEGDAAQVLPRLNFESYDLVTLDADPTQLLDYFALAMQIVRPGGSVIILGAFGQSKVPDPAARDLGTQNLRDLLNSVEDSPGLVAALSPAGDGLLTITRLPKTPVADA